LAHAGSYDALGRTCGGARSRLMPPVRLVIASRPLAILDEMSPTEAQQLVLQPFSPPQLAEFSDNWFKGASDGKSAAAFREELAAARLEGLAAFPSLATMAAVVYERSADGTLPRRRSELIDRFIELALEERDEEAWQGFCDACGKVQRGRGPALASELWASREGIATSIAIRIQDGAVALSGGELVAAAVAGAIETRVLPQARPGSSAMESYREIMLDLLLSSGLFQHSPNGSVAFVHNTLREALVARRLAEKLPDSAAGVWEFARRWVEPRWREIVLLVLVRWSMDGLREEVWFALQPLLKSSPRGLHFVGTAVGEGLSLPEAAEDQVIAAMLDRADGWSPCAELFSEFRSPNPTDVLRTLSRRPTFTSALLKRLTDTDASCSVKVWSLAELTLDIGSAPALRALLERDLVRLKHTRRF
jgi:hypothetical protein